jgi:hypothetical protein
MSSGTVIRHKVGDDPNAGGMGVIDEHLQIILRTEPELNIEKIRYVIAVVCTGLAKGGKARGC